MRKDDARLLDIVLACQEAMEFTTGVERQQYLEDRKLQVALCMELEMIGEAARTVSEEFKASHQEIPWKAIVGLRHRVVHEYFRLDQDIIWEIVQKDIPDLLQKVLPFVPPDK